MSANASTVVSSVGEHQSGSPLPELARAITAGAVRLAAATAAWLRLVAEFDERGGWHGVGISSCAHWLAWQCGLAPVTAREHVRVARALQMLPQTAAAFSAGRLSYAKVRALTRIAAPDCEASLVEFALSATASQTERFCRAWRRADTPDPGGPDGGRPAETEQVFDSWTDEEGYLTLTVRMPAEAGAALMTAIDSLAERAARRERAQNTRARARHEQIRTAGGEVDRVVAERCADDVEAGMVRERTAARRIAALGALAEARVALDRRPGDPPRREVVVHVDAAVLADDTAAGRAYLEGGPPISAAQACRMLCEATAVVMLEHGREPLAVGRRRRRATPAQRRALLRRDGGCARPGCPESRIERLHAHHMRHWLHGGRTDLPNLVLLCDVDHGLVHEHDLVMTRRDGRLVVLDRDGRRVWGTADAAFTGGIDDLGSTSGADADAHDEPDTTADPFAGVHPIDTVVGRRPTPQPTTTAAPRPAPDAARTPPPPAPGRRVARRVRPAPRPAPRPASRPSPRRAADRLRPPHGRPPSFPGRPAETDGRGPAADRAAAPDTTAHSAPLGRLLFPDGEPVLPDSLQERYDRMDLRHAIGVLMGNRDLARRLAAEAGVPLTG